MKLIIETREELIRELDTKTNELDKVKKALEEPNNKNISVNVPKASSTRPTTNATATIAIPKTANPNFKRFL